MTEYWIVKRHYNGGTSIMTPRYEDRSVAQRLADRLNEQYQTDEYRVERWLS